MRKRLIAGNWKMFNGPEATKDFLRNLSHGIASSMDIIKDISEGKMDVVLFPPAVSIEAAVIGKGNAPVLIGGQNVHWADNGAFTGEISVPMLKEVGCSHVIIGHSERRHIFHETNEELHKKMTAVINGGLTAVLCVGELLVEREAGNTYEVVRTQLLASLSGMDTSVVQKQVIVAYEPVWAIGTGKTAGCDDAQEVCSFIRKVLGDAFGEGIANRVLILYGGSVKPENTEELLSQNDIDGVLVGGASLNVESFLKIIKAAVIL